LFPLLCNLGGSFFRCNGALHLVEGIYVEGERIELTFVFGHRGIDKAVEVDEPGDIVPDLFVVGMKDVSTVNVDVDALNLFGIDVAADIFAFFDDKDSLSAVHGLAGEDSTI